MGLTVAKVEGTHIPVGSHEEATGFPNACCIGQTEIRAQEVDHSITEHCREAQTHRRIGRSLGIGAPGPIHKGKLDVAYGIGNNFGTLAGIILEYRCCGNSQAAVAPGAPIACPLHALGRRILSGDGIFIDGLDNSLPLALCKVMIQPIIADAYAVAHLCYPQEAVRIPCGYRAGVQKLRNRTVGKLPLAADVIDHGQPGDPLGGLVGGAEELSRGNGVIVYRGGENIYTVFMHPCVPGSDVGVCLYQTADPVKVLLICLDPGVDILRTSIKHRGNRCRGNRNRSSCGSCLCHERRCQWEQPCQKGQEQRNGNRFLQHNIISFFVLALKSI